MENLNSYICQLDPTLHTLAYVQEKSSFLFTTVLAVAAKILNPSAYPALKDHAETLFTENFRRGDKSPEVIQAILILTYWKELDDTRAWLNVGYAIRLSMDLGWHKLSTEDDEHLDHRNSLDHRKRRNIERTWLVLFVYDRRLVVNVYDAIERCPIRRRPGLGRILNTEVLAHIHRFLGITL